MEAMTPCDEWDGKSINSSGYGYQHVPGRGTVGVHVLAWESANGPVPKGQEIRHGCHNKRCIEIEHLCLGNRSENMLDSLKDGRLSAAKLRPEHVSIIRELIDRGLSQATIAAVAGVSKSAISKIATGRKWAWMSA